MTEQKKVLIVGGGTAGWLTAGILASRFKQSGQCAVSVSVVESPNVQTIGVGEGTWPSMRLTLQKMGVSETDFIRECDVSLKQGSRFNGWVTGQADHYYHPYSLPASYSEFNLAPFWQAARDKVSFADAVSQQAALCDLGLAPKQISTPEYAFNVNYGYHLNAAKFAAFLQKHCSEKLGVKHIIAHVNQVSSHDNGDIEALHTDTDQRLAGDLFIDCTGFASLLIGKHYGIKSKSLDNIFFNDSALTAQVPYLSDNEPIASHTISTAQSAGWVWDIGLPNRRGVGYVYASNYCSDDAAEEVLRAYLEPRVGRDVLPEVSTRKLSFTPSYRNEFWHKNCVAIGLSAGFVEPLEASAIALIEQSAKMVAEQFPENRRVMSIMAARFNDRFHYHWRQIIDFLKLHYVLNQRDDEVYWQDHRGPDSIPASLQESLLVWQTRSPWHLDTPVIDEMFPSASYQYVLYGMGFSTLSNLVLRQNEQDQMRATHLFNENSKRTRQLQQSLPSNRDLIQKIHEFGLPTL